MRVAPLCRQGVAVVPRVHGAFSAWQRLRGLLFRPRLAADGSEALMLSPCSNIHTFGMAYPLDLVYLDRGGTVIGLRENVRPWRASYQRGAKATVELHGGALKALDIRVGDVLQWQ